MQEITMYKAKDGACFESQDDCINHERYGIPKENAIDEIWDIMVADVARCVETTPDGKPAIRFGKFRNVLDDKFEEIDTIIMGYHKEIGDYEKSTL